MTWFALILAGILEAGWLVGIDKSESFTKWSYLLLALCSMALSLMLFAFAVKSVPTHIAYLVWLAVGTGTITFVNYFFFCYSMTLAQWFFLLIILLGVVGLKVSSNSVAP